MTHIVRIPGDHVAWQGETPAEQELSVPFAVRVIVTHTREHLREAVGDPVAAAHSFIFNEVDESGVGAAILFSHEDLELSLVAHEVTHVALQHASNVESSRVGARKWLHEHPEWVAEMIGNLTAIVWSYLLTYFIGEPEPEPPPTPLV